MDLLHPVRIGNAENCCFLDRRVLVNDLFDFARKDVLASRNNHVLLPVNDVNVAFLIIAAKVPSVHPSVYNRLAGLVRLTPPLLHRRFAPNNEFADFTRGNVLVIFVNNPDMNADMGEPG